MPRSTSPSTRVRKIQEELQQCFCHTHVYAPTVRDRFFALTIGTRTIWTVDEFVDYYQKKRDHPAYFGVMPDFSGPYDLAEIIYREYLFFCEHSTTNILLRQ